MAKVNTKNTNKNLVMVIVLLVILLLAAVVTNDRARQFLTNSFADGGRVNGCQDKGSPSERCVNVDKREGRSDLGGSLGGRSTQLNGGSYLNQFQNWLNSLGDRLNGSGFKGGKSTLPGKN